MKKSLRDINEGTGAAPDGKQDQKEEKKGGEPDGAQGDAGRKPPPGPAGKT